MRDLILLVEDDIEFGETVKDYFESNGLPVIWAKDGKAAIQFFKNGNPRLVLLDVQLPDSNGFEVATEIQKINSIVPLIFMTGTALADEDFTNAYLNLHAKNYLEKPVKLPVALAQVKSLLYPPSVKVYTLQNIKIRIEEQLVTINNKEFLLRDKDIQVFSVLLDNINQTVEHKDILQKVWNNDGVHLYNTLNNCISRIRKVLKVFPSINLMNIYGTGYKLSIEKE